MTRIVKDVEVRAAPDAAWDAIRDFGNPHTRAFPGVLTDAKLEGDTRTVTFANGLVAREALIDCNDDAKCLVYTASGGSLAHHNASLQVFANGDGGSRVVWILDLLPNQAAPTIEGLMDAGCAAMKAALEH